MRAEKRRLDKELINQVFDQFKSDISKSEVKKFFKKNRIKPSVKNLLRFMFAPKKEIGFGKEEERT